MSEAVDTSAQDVASKDTRAIALIVLAAGSSSRMGEHKLLLPLSDRPLLTWSIEAASASDARPITLALGRAASDVAAALPAGPYTIVVNHRYADGMGTSLALAVAQLPEHVLGTLIVLGDQPFMPTAAINAVLAAARTQPERIAMAAYGSRRGHPVYLPRRLFEAVMALNDDEGARTIIAREGDAVTLVPFFDDDALFDVDTPEDYQRAQALARRRAPGQAQPAENTPS